MWALLKKGVLSAAMVALSWIWRMPLRWFFRPRLVFMVYPGSRRYIRKFLFDWVYEHVPMPNIIPIGLIVRPGMIGVYASTRELLLEVDGHRLREVTEQIPAAFPFARSVSLAGSWPSLCRKAGFSAATPPLVDAALGTAYAMDRVCEAMVKRRGKEPSEACLCVLGGGGFVGNVLLPRIRDGYRRIVVVDPCYAAEEVDGSIHRSNDGRRIGEADAVLVLTPRGDDVAEHVEHAAAGQVWGDDTFPDMTASTQQRLRDAGVELFKTAMVDPSLSFIPPLPTFGRRRVPGCLISALVNERRPGVVELDEFYAVADELGLEARLFPHGADSR